MGKYRCLYMARYRAEVKWDRLGAVARTFDAIIIGAGIMGLSVAYYLKKKHCPRVLVLEKEDSWINGSTARANGGFRQQFSTAINIQLSRISVSVFESFREDFEIDISLRQYGYLFVTASESGETALRANLKLQRDHDVPVEWLAVDDIRKLAPFLRLEDVRGGTYCARDGYADAYSIAEGFGRMGRSLGAEMEFGQPVEKVLTDSGRVRGVATPQGEVHAPVIVNAAGPYAGKIGKLAGIDVPVVPVRRMMVMTEDFPDIPETIPMTIDADTGFLMRKEGEKVLMGWADPDEPAGFNSAFDSSFVDVVAQKALHRVPMLERAQINPKRSWAGLYEITPDHHCILDESQEVSGFFLMNGFSGHGMMHSPAAGMILAELIVDGKTDLVDIRRLRLSRFREGDLIDETVVL